MLAPGAVKTLHLCLSGQQLLGGGGVCICARACTYVRTRERYTILQAKAAPYHACEASLL